MSNITTHEREGIRKAAELFVGLGASQVFLFGSAVEGRLRTDSDVDMAVSGLSPDVYFSAVSQASDLIGRSVDLVDLDDDSRRVQYLRESGRLIRVA